MFLKVSQYNSPSANRNSRFQFGQGKAETEYYTQALNPL